MLSNHSQDHTAKLHCFLLCESLDSSMETIESVGSDAYLDKNKIKPSEQVSLFRKVGKETFDQYTELFQKLENILTTLEELLPPVSICDDYAIRPKMIVLRNPDRRRTLQPK